MSHAQTRERAPDARLMIVALLLCTMAAAPVWAQVNDIIEGPAARELAEARGMVVREETPAGVMELQRFVRGMPWYFITHNEDAADSLSTDECLPGGSTGLGLTGSGVTLGIWDGGGVRTTHQEFGGRATQIDSPSSTNYHSTHVAGTMIASGVQFAAKGMSPAADLDCWEWNNDTSEMRSAAGSGLRVSNHSYGYVHGWYYNYSYYEWFWYGDVTISTTEDYKFGLYSSESYEYDDIAYDRPYYLICKSAGNDRNDDGPGAGGGHYYYNPSSGSWQWSTTTRDPDGDWDCVGTTACAKNILAVAAIDDVIGGYSGSGSVGMSSFSAWGPTDDGRIKPDIAANGIELYSTYDTSNSAYDTLSGTSMASPNAAGSLGLLIQHWRNTHTGDMRSSTLKGLVLHTADECGSYNGPDYKFGWGLMNTKTAAETISEDVSEPLTITEQTLSTGQTYELYVTTDGSASELRASICWTDVPGTPPGDVLNPTTKMLVNDLDLRVIKASPSTTYYPWTLNPSSPSSGATTGDNDTDNVEQVVVSSPGTNTYTIRVTHKGSLSGGSQAYALIITGAASISESQGTQYTLTVNTSGSGTVSLNPSGGTYDENTWVQLTANPAAGWHFDHWEGDLTGSTNPDSIYMDEDKTVTAVFAQDQYTLTVNVTGSGTVSKNPDLASYNYGQTVWLTANAATGWHFDHWEGDLTGSTNPDNIYINGNKTVTAVFVQDQYTLTVNVSGSGSVSKSPNQSTYTYGQTVQLTANAATGWHFDHWTGALTGSTNPDSVYMDGNKTVTAVFVQDQYTLTANVTGNGSVSKSPNQSTYTYGQTVQLTANADAGWTFDHWEGDLTGSTNPDSIYMDGSKTVTAVFTQDQYTLVVNVTGNGSVTKNPNQATYTYGQTVQLTANADTGWHFDRWEGDLTGSTNPDTITMDGDKTVTAVFVEDQYSLTINITGSGSVTKNPNQGTYTYGQIVQLTANADPGWTFDHWAGDLAGSTNPDTITMDGDKTVTAVFVQDQYTLTINVVGSGSVDKDPDQATYTYGQIVDVTAIADAGWTFDYWSDDLSGSVNPETIVMNGNRTITAHFTQDEYTLTVNIAGNGSVTKYPDRATYIYGQTVELTASADMGWHFDHWEGDLTGSTNPDSVYMDGSKTVTAVFVQDGYTLMVSVIGAGSVDKSPDQPTYTYGQTVQLTANADAGWTFDHWEDDLTGSTNPDNIYMDGDKTVTAVFVQDQYTLTVNVVGSGAVTLDPDQTTYTYGQVVELTADADLGWTFDHWEGDLTGSTNPDTITMDGDKTATAVFVQNQYALTVTIVGMGLVDKLPDQATYTHGQTVQLTANADVGWMFDHWEGDLTGSTNPDSVYMDGPKFVTAVFVQNQYTLTINVTGNGSVSKSPDQATYTYGQAVDLTANADPGWTFSHWDGDLTGSDNPDTIIMDGNKTVTAVFTQDLYTLSINVVGSGSVSLNPNEAGYTYGQLVELTANANAGWTFDHWEGDLTGSTNPDTITMDGHKLVTAVFVQDQYSLTVNVTGQGSVTLTPAGGSYSYGTWVDLEAFADSGWSFDRWEGDLSGSTNPESIYMDGPKTVTAVFVITDDCNGNGVPDADDLTSGVSVDCNANGVPDECDIDDLTSPDCNANGIPDECEIDGRNGLSGAYFDDQGFVGTLRGRIDATVDFDWGNGVPWTGFGADDFSIQWTGYVLTPAVSGDYTFYTTTDDGVRLWVDGQLLIDEWIDQSATEWSGVITLEADSVYEIVMEFYENGGDAVAELRWQPPGQSKVIIPMANLLP
ncbi:MAG: S8 family serine peptidase, partial [Phycisphaerae bacterium]|nr:S8 family serine peptidase [Phycisphaerae bacterium]